AVAEEATLNAFMREPGSLEDHTRGLVPPPPVPPDPPELACERFARNRLHGARGQTSAARVFKQPIADLDHAPHRVEVAKRDAAEERSVDRVLDDVRDEDAAGAHLREQLSQSSTQLVLVKWGHSDLAADAGVAERGCDDWNVPLLGMARDNGPVDIEAVRYRESGEGRLGHRGRS